MIKILQVTALVIVASFTSSMSFSAPAKAQDNDNNLNDQVTSQTETAPAAPSVLQRMWAIQKLDYKKWGIRKGCISNGKIKRIKFIDDRSAMISMFGKKKAIMRLKNRCPGIKKHGFCISAMVSGSALNIVAFRL